MMASAPSKTAVATSETSARVGTGAVIINSSICVATTTGLPARRAARVICFWMPGTASSGISTPRSPRATISASESSMISGRRATACGFSILDRSSARPRAILRASARSSGRWMKDSATQSTPAASTASRSLRSFSVSAPTGRSVSGRLTPFLSEILVPATTVQTIDLPSLLHRLQLQLAVVDQQPMAGLDRAAGSPDAAGARASTSPGAGLSSSVKVWPDDERRPCRRRTCRRAASAPAGRRECRSAGRRSSSTARMRPTSVRIRSWSVWLILMRKTSAPASNSFWIISVGRGGGTERGEDLDLAAASH